MLNRIYNWVKQNPYVFLFAGIGLVYFCNLFINIMEVDAAQYASMAKEMLNNGSYLQVYDQGKDYLDKPPLLFWLGALSFKVFGIHNWSYKLPALCLLILGIYSTYRLSKHWYSKEVALLAALLVAGSNAFFLMTNDVRTDGILTGFVVFAVWQLQEFIIGARFKHLLLAALGVAGALLSKGPVGAAIVVLALGAHWLYRLEWKFIFKWQWLLLLLMVAVLLLPMCYGLYQQFDLHPEKEVYGLKGPSGILFFFYTQSFGRLTGDIYWDNHAPFLYFLETILWDMLPWVALFFVAFGFKVYDMASKRFRFEPNKEYFSFFGFLLPFLALSASHFKLPHYVFPIFPFAAILTANFLLVVLPSFPKLLGFFKGLQTVVTAILLVLMGISLFLFFPETHWVIYVVYAACLLVYAVVLKQKLLVQHNWFMKHVFAFQLFSLLMAVYFNPTLLTFQYSSQVANVLNQEPYASAKVYTTDFWSRSFHYYTKNTITHASEEQIANMKSGMYLVCTQDDSAWVQKAAGGNLLVEQSFPSYPVTQLSPEFLLASTRPNLLRHAYLFKKP